MERWPISSLTTSSAVPALRSCVAKVCRLCRDRHRRHTTAMHLLQAGVDIATIALWLGHESIETTHVYLAADLAMKEKALEKLDPIAGEWQRFHADDSLLAFLASL